MALGAIVLLSQPNSSSAALVTPPELAPADLATGFSLGKADAPVKIEMWEDLQCTACGLFSRQIEPRIVTQYVVPGTVQLTFNDFAFIGSEVHGGKMPTAFGQDESVDAAIAARCAGAQGPGNFWHFQQYLYWNQGTENGGKFTKAFFDKIASAMGLDRTTFDSCLTDSTQLKAVISQTEQGQRQGINATPTLFINGTKVMVSTYDQLAADIDAAAKGQPLPSTGAGSSVPETTVAPSAAPAASPAASATP